MSDDLRIMLFTLQVAAVSTAFNIPVALALAVSMRLLPRKIATIVETIATLPLVLPPTAVGFLLLELLSRQRAFGKLLDRLGVEVLFTPRAVILATAVMSFPLIYRAFRAALETVDSRYFDVARTLGATPSRAFFRVVVPLAWRGMMAGILLAYCRALGEFGATVLVAGNIPGRTQTIALAIYQRVQSGQEEAARPLLFLAVILAFSAVAISEYVARLEERRA